MAINNIPGIDKAALQALPTARDRLSFLYLEHCMLNRQDGAITVTDVRGTVHVPAAALAVLLLGPGTNISHRAMELISESGSSVIWVGEQGVRYYAHGRSLTHSARLQIRQAELVSNVRSRIAVARQMYQLRFPGEDVSALTMQQLRGREGARIRFAYRAASRESGIAWNGREYVPGSFDSSDEINKALAAAHACLYGVVHSVIVALGCSPALGFVHTGHELSFVYDIADLYKAELTIPIAFAVTAAKADNIGSAVRHKMRDTIASGHILEKTVKDIRWLLLGQELAAKEIETNVLHLWDDKDGLVAHAVSYGKELEQLEDELEEGYGIIVDEQA
jgi:CRISPR-associated protein Cas1